MTKKQAEKANLEKANLEKAMAEKAKAIEQAKANLHPKAQAFITGSFVTREEKREIVKSIIVYLQATGLEVKEYVEETIGRKLTNSELDKHRMYQSLCKSIARAKAKARGEKLSSDSKVEKTLSEQVQAFLSRLSKVDTFTMTENKKGQLVVTITPKAEEE